MRQLSIAFLLALTSGCPSSSTLDIDASSATDACPLLDLCLVYACFDGVTRGAQVVSDPCPHCAYVPITPDPCPGGCIGGAYGITLADVCRAQPGSTCATDADCTPSAATNGFGGAVDLVCNVARSQCVPMIEACDGTDDDLDGAIDEGCACSPAVSAPIEDLEGLVDHVVMAGDRILITTASDVGGSAALVDHAGAAIARVAQGNTMDEFFASAWFGVSGFGMFTHPTMFGTPDTIWQVATDGTATHQAVMGSTATVELAAPSGPDFVVFAPSGTTSWAVTRFGGAPLASVATGSIDTHASATLHMAELTSGDLLVLDAAAGMGVHAIALDASLTSRETAAASAMRQGDLAPPAIGADRIWIATSDAAGLQSIVSLDRATGAWAESFPLGTFSTFASTLVAVALDATHLFASWYGTDGAVRTLMLDMTGHIVGRSVVGSSDAPSGVWLGTTDHGVCAIVQRLDGVRLIDPCPMP